MDSNITLYFLFYFSHQTVIIAVVLSLMLCLPELRIRIHMTEPLLWELTAVDPIWEFAPAQTFITLHPVLIWSLPKDTDRDKRVEACRGSALLDKYLCSIESFIRNVLTYYLPLVWRCLDWPCSTCNGFLSSTPPV